MLWFAYGISAGCHILLGVMIVLDQLGGKFIQGLKTAPHITKGQKSLFFFKKSRRARLKMLAGVKSSETSECGSSQ